MESIGPKRQEVLNKILRARHEIFPIVMNPPLTQHRLSTIALGCPPSLDSKTVLVKTPRALVAGHTEINFSLTGKLPPCWLAYMVPVDTMEISR